MTLEDRLAGKEACEIPGLFVGFGQPGNAIVWMREGEEHGMTWGRQVSADEAAAYIDARLPDAD